jgi:hypothetical protein
MVRLTWPFALALLVAPTVAWAGPPFLTDDPEPTETDHWEIYGPLIEGEGKGVVYEGSVGAEINYGAAPGVQITVGLPMAYSHDGTGMRWGVGDVAVSVKYRFYHDEGAGIQIAVFPGMTLPTASYGMGNGKITGLLPVWVQKDTGPWSVFRQGADTVGGNGSTSLGIGAIYQMKAPFRLLASGGPTFEDGGGAAGFHAFLALGLDF